MRSHTPQISHAIAPSSAFCDRFIFEKGDAIAPKVIPSFDWA
ncbi:MAG: hypothetical protein WA947_18290 [Phormidesmis sp.]